MYLTTALHRAVQQDPGRLFSIHGDRVRTVAETVDRVSRLAGALRGSGVGTGDRVALLALNSDRFAEVLLAVPWAGAALNPVNIRWSVAEIAYSLRESGTTTLVVDDAFAPAVPALRAAWDGLRTVLHCGDGPLPDGAVGLEEALAAADPVPDARRGGSAELGVFYTGGTTGTPRGVLLSHDNVLVSAFGSLAAGGFITPHGRLLHVAPLFHMAGIAAWVAGLLVGSTHVHVPAFTPAATLDAITTHGVTDALLVPTMIRMLLDDPGLADHDLSGVRRVVYGASPIPDDVLDRARAAFPRAGFTQAYGMTELAPVATLLLPSDHDDPQLRRTAGRAAPHAEVRVLDPDGGEVPRGAVGEIAVRGDHVMLGYLDRPAETAAAVRDGWLHTGDLGVMDERGYVAVVDRLKDMIITGGENVYSAEVENALAGHPDVAACAVIGLPDERWGERVHAVVVPRPGTDPDAEALREHCRARIAGYKVPRTVAFADALPLSAAGKVLKHRLRADAGVPA